MTEDGGAGRARSGEDNPKKEAIFRIGRYGGEGCREHWIILIGESSLILTHILGIWFISNRQLWDVAIQVASKTVLSNPYPFSFSRRTLNTMKV